MFPEKRRLRQSPVRAFPALHIDPDCSGSRISDRQPEGLCDKAFRSPNMQVLGSDKRESRIRDDRMILFEPIVQHAVEAVVGERRCRYGCHAERFKWLGSVRGNAERSDLERIKKACQVVFERNAWKIARTYGHATAGL
jgi:hypothetical protein